MVQVILDLQNLEEKISAAIAWSDASYGDASVMSSILADISEGVEGIRINLVQMEGGLS